LLIRGDSLLILDLGLHIVNGVRWCDIQGNCLAYDKSKRKSSNQAVSITRTTGYTV
jgi:hypothetical protein